MAQAQSAVAQIRFTTVRQATSVGQAQSATTVLEAEVGYFGPYTNVAPGVIIGEQVPEAPPESEINPFKRLTVENHFHVLTEKSNLVQWALNPEFQAPRPYTYRLYRGRSVNDDELEAIAETVDQPWLFDRRPAPRPHERSTYYKVRLTDKSGCVYWSQPVSYDTFWNHYDWRLARQILRKEMLLLKKRAGTPGALLKRRQFGERCPACFDINTQQASDARCPVCFGTGYAGGYFAPVDYSVLQAPSRRMTKLSESLGTMTSVMETVRALAHPSPEPQDIWVQRGSGARFEVQEDITKQARLRGVDLILGLRLMELPRNHIVYDIPVDFSYV